jgi:hypothetical protein
LNLTGDNFLSQMMVRIILPAIFLLFVISCANPENKSTISESDSSFHQVDSTLKDVEQSAATIFNPDTFRIIDSLVKEINAKIKKNLLTKKTINEMDVEGGYVYGYYYPDKTIAYLYSSSAGGEFGRDEIKSFYKNGTLLYSIFRYYEFEVKSNGNSNSSKEFFKAEKIFYLPKSDLRKDSITIFNSSPKYDSTGYPIFTKSEFPTAKNIGIKTDHLVKHLAVWGQ